MDKELTRSDPTFTEESERLAWTQEKFAEQIVENKEFFDALPDLYQRMEDIDVRNDLLTLTHNRIIRLERGVDKPYFARIDFTESGEEETGRLYLGKIGVVDGEEHLVVLDWRAPVSTLYYDSNVGEVSYDSPGGVVTGNLSLKRQLEIENGRLISWGDVDTVANDDLLRPYLGVNADNRLKNIIATIQSEQNRIIRERLDVNLVVQGAAGSGKTTVALHRIAYLAYTYRDSIKPGQYMVIGPNRFFISYISAVLPDLDVDSVPQCTYEELVKDALGEEYRVTDKAIRLGEVVAGRDGGAVERFKTSMVYKEALDRFLADFEDSFLPSGDFSVKGFLILEEQELREAWEQARAGVAETVKAKVEQCILYLSRQIMDRAMEYSALLSAHFRGLYRQEGQISIGSTTTEPSSSGSWKMAAPPR